MARTKFANNYTQRPQETRDESSYKLLRTTRSTIKESWAQSTSNQHKKGLRQFVNYLREVGIPQKNWFPAHETILCNFANSFKGRIAGSTIRAKLHGVRAFHVLHNYRYAPGNLLKQTLKGLDKATPQTSKQAQRKPITKEMMDVLNAGLDTTKSFDVTVKFHANGGFMGQIRLGEILPTSSKVESFDATSFPTGKDILPAFSPHGSFSLHLPKTKTSQVNGEDASLCKQGGEGDPVDSKNLHVGTNKIAADTPLASYLLPSGKRKVLTKKAFLKRCNEIWAAAGYGRMTGHSFRIGGTTYFLLAGVDTEVVKAMGRWSSDAFLKYWRDLEKLGILHVELLDVKRKLSKKNRTVRIVG